MSKNKNTDKTLLDKCSVAIMVVFGQENVPDSKLQRTAMYPKYYKKSN